MKIIVFNILRHYLFVFHNSYISNSVIRKMKTEGRRILKSGQSIANSGGKKKEIMRDIQITGMQKE